MKTFFHSFQNYKQAPWRTQLQWIGLILTGLVILAIISAFYVTVTTRTALAGREIGFAKDNISIQHDISDLESEIASLTSSQKMHERAVSMGFIPAGPEDYTYIYVAGYTPKTAINLSSIDAPDPQPIVLPEYTESIFDWFTNRGHP